MMVFWWTMFFFNLFYPACMIVAGWWMWKHPPKNIQSILGYRTRRSMQSPEAWAFAHAHFGRNWWRIGWALLPVLILLQLPVYGADKDTVGNMSLVICCIGLAAIILPIFPTERALKKQFPDGK